MDQRARQARDQPEDVAMITIDFTRPAQLPHFHPNSSVREVFASLLCFMLLFNLPCIWYVVCRRHEQWRRSHSSWAEPFRSQTGVAISSWLLRTSQKTATLLLTRCSGICWRCGLEVTPDASPGLCTFKLMEGLKIAIGTITPMTDLTGFRLCMQNSLRDAVDAASLAVVRLDLREPAGGGAHPPSDRKPRSMRDLARNGLQDQHFRAPRQRLIRSNVTNIVGLLQTLSNAYVKKETRPTITLIDEVRAKFALAYVDVFSGIRLSFLDVAALRTAAAWTRPTSGAALCSGREGTAWISVQNARH
jgi:hypothetical protein